MTKANTALKYLIVRDVMEQMETLSRIKYAGRYGELLTEAFPIQREILNAFDTDYSA